jgi:hypothetical protein
MKGRNMCASLQKVVEVFNDVADVSFWLPFSNRDKFGRRTLGLRRIKKVQSTERRIIFSIFTQHYLSYGDRTVMHGRAKNASCAEANLGTGLRATLATP